MFGSLTVLHPKLSVRPLMIGQGCPNLQLADRCNRSPRLRLLWFCAQLLAANLVAPLAHGEQIDVRLRIIWGNGSGLKQLWTGYIDFGEAELSNLAPLGMERDAAVAQRIEGGRILIEPITSRGFDGCDITVRGDSEEFALFHLQSSHTAEPTEIRKTLGELAASSVPTQRLDESGGSLLVRRAPGDEMRVILERDSLVLSPHETLAFSIQPDLENSAPDIRCEVSVRASTDSRVLWQATSAHKSDAKRVRFAAPCPDQEGVYRVVITAKEPESLPFRLTPGHQHRTLASREFEFVVIDPEQRFPTPTNHWDEVFQFDPANPTWRDRLPQLPEWTHVERFGRSPAARALGNVHAPTVALDDGRFMLELPAQADDVEPSWRAFVLPIASPGELHAVEIATPQSRAQDLAISVIEPNSAGRVRQFGQDAGFVSNGRDDLDPTSIRFEFWPRTASPVLLIANRGSTPASFGQIRILKEAASATDSSPAPEVPRNAERTVTAYFSQPDFPWTFGAPQRYDAEAQLSVQGWTTFIESTRRLVHYLRRNQYDSAIVAVAADGSSLTPLDAFGQSPRYDGGALTEADPVRKDVLEAMLRIFDRENLQLIPAVRLAAPVASLEQLRRSGNPLQDGFAWVDANGKTWRQRQPADALAAPRYNLLHPNIQQAIVAALKQFPDRYGSHPSFGGLALQADGQGYGVLPGVAWGMSDSTIARFSADSDITLPSQGDQVHQARYRTLHSEHLDVWKRWRSAQSSAFYKAAGKMLRQVRSDLRLVICTEQLLTGVDLQQRLRRSIVDPSMLDQLIAEVGFDSADYSDAEEIILTRARPVVEGRTIQEDVLDARISEGRGLDTAFGGLFSVADLYHYALRPLDLPSFDIQSPFGAEQTRLSLRSPATAIGNESRRPFVTAFARRDRAHIIVGGPLAHTGIGDDLAPFFDVYRALPNGNAEIRTERKRPIIVRTYREADQTTICVINPSPWAIKVTVDVSANGTTQWIELGVKQSQRGDEATSGEIPTGANAWTASLKPYAIAARQFADARLRMGSIQVEVANEARAELARRMLEIEQRLGSIDYRRRYDVLQNPGFEQEPAANQSIPYWHAMTGAGGEATLAGDSPRSGAKALRLVSDGQSGVAVRSASFDIPETRQLTLMGQVRFRDCDDTTKLYVRFEYETPAGSDFQWAVVNPTHHPRDEWASFELTTDVLPLGDEQNMSITFQLAEGGGEASIDDLELIDVRLGDAQRLGLGKTFYAAQRALNSGRLQDCLDLVDSYWPKYLVEYVPAAASADGQLVRDTTTPTTNRLDIASRPESQQKPEQGDNRSEKPWRIFPRRLIR